MRIDILTLFPEMFAPLKSSLMGKAVDKKLIEINLVDIRDFSKDKHKKCDDYCFGGGAGMLMMVQPIYDAVRSIKDFEKARKIFLSPRGKLFLNEIAKKLSLEKHLILLCGHYEGVDERVLQMFDFEELSIGDFILSGGEIPAMAVVDATLRFIPGVLGNEESTVDESFSNGMLEYPQYTRPANFEGFSVPEVLLSGNHKEIEKWKREKSRELTMFKRPDLQK